MRYIIVGFDISNHIIVSKFCASMSEVFDFIHHYVDPEIIHYSVYKEMDEPDE